MPIVEQLYVGDNPLSTIDFNRDEIKKKLEKLKKTAAPGPDNLWPKVLQSLAEELSSPLSMIYTKCLDEGTVPLDWKRGHITPIFKKGSKASPCNYRPVSSTSVLCKVMESSLTDAIVLHL